MGRPRRWSIGLYRVAGNSMLPTYRPGEILVGLRIFNPRAGQVVVAYTDRPIVKRISRIEGHQVWLEGDNAEASTDSRHFGPVKLAQLEAKIIAKIM